MSRGSVRFSFKEFFNCQTISRKMHPLGNCQTITFGVFGSKQMDDRIG
jgi:hypothetical protein